MQNTIKPQSELQLQASCFQWAWNHHPETRRCLFHIPNGAGRNKIEAMQLKASGVVAGAHDLIFIWNGHVYTFELKVGANRQSPEQVAFGQAVAQQGAKIYEIRSLDQFQQIFNSILCQTN